VCLLLPQLLLNTLEMVGSKLWTFSNIYET
jgi:hypothetical protein